MASLSSAHDVLPQIFLMTDGSVDDEHNICQTVKTELISRGSKSPRISTFGLGNVKESVKYTIISLFKTLDLSPGSHENSPPYFLHQRSCISLSPNILSCVREKCLHHITSQCGDICCQLVMRRTIF